MPVCLLPTSLSKKMPLVQLAYGHFFANASFHMFQKQAPQVQYLADTGEYESRGGYLTKSPGMLLF